MRPNLCPESRLQKLIIAGFFLFFFHTRLMFLIFPKRAQSSFMILQHHGTKHTDATLELLRQNAMAEIFRGFPDIQKVTITVAMLSG